MRLLVLLSAAAAVLAKASLHVDNKCKEPVFLFTQTEANGGHIKNNVHVKAGAKHVDMGISEDWKGALNVGTGCNDDGTKCKTGGPTWDGNTPFSRAEFNFVSNSFAFTF